MSEHLDKTIFERDEKVIEKLEKEEFRLKKEGKELTEKEKKHFTDELEKTRELNQDDVIRMAQDQELDREYQLYKIQKRNEHAEKASSFETSAVLTFQEMEREFIEHENEHDQYLIDRLEAGEKSERDEEEIKRLKEKIEKRNEWLTEKIKAQTDAFSKHQAKEAYKVLSRDKKDFDKQPL